ncbi:MAG: GHKL domain-containing protein [Flavobacteriaceae bacterium]|nr:GHKL domain-containing protein [Flavobacteriaceae bacterium]
MQLRKTSLRTRIFVAMILLVVIASILIALITIYQYSEQSKDYHEARLLRKENTIKTSIDIELMRRTTYPIDTEHLDEIFKDKIYDISDINQMDVYIYDLEGKLKISSVSTFGKDTTDYDISEETLADIANDGNHRVVLEKRTPQGNKYQSSYSYINDNKFKPIGILHLHYLNDNTFQEKELREFLSRLALVYLLMLLIAITIAYLVSKYITKSIKTVSEKINQTRLDKRNEKIILNNASEEMHNLVNAYNDMVDELGESAVKLAKSEREQAWREMAKQVAHEIKNPLTPMRLTVQSFEQRFDPEDPNAKEKINEFSKSLIQQIDTMSSIASAFSNFAEMPRQKREELDVVEVVKLAIDIFNEDYIHYFNNKDKIIAKLDKTQLIRVVTNLVKNAIHSVVEQEHPKIEVKVSEDNGNVIISVADNGKGITEEDKNKIFEPKFTTKSSGMGLGLPMIKNIVEAYNGNITFVSQQNHGTVFTVTIPKE